MDWEPPFRFDVVRTELEYVPDDRQRELVQMLLGGYLVTCGRLVVCSYGGSRREAEPVGETLQGWGYNVAGESKGTDTNGAIITRDAWTDAPRSMGT